MMHPTWVGRTAWFRAHPYDPRAVRCEDQDLLLRTWRSSEFASLGDLVLGYREERLRIRASLEARRALASSYRRHGVGTPAAARQIGLGVVDAATALARLDEARLRRRVTALTAADAARWTALWADVGGDQRA